MKTHNAVIKDIAYYHPNNSVNSEFFIKHFDKQGIDIRHLLDATGIQNRYISNDINETVLTMGINATKILIKKSKIDVKKINQIIFSTSTPEYISPTHALKVHEAIRASQNCIVYDLNSNCVGMLIALNQACQSMRSNSSIKYTLIVGSDQLSKYSRFDEALTYANFADSACAIIVENVPNTTSGFIDYDAYTNSSNHNKVLMPAKGMSSVIHDKKLEIKDKLLHWSPFDTKGAFNSSIISIENIISKNNLTKKDIKKYFLSQFAKSNIQHICEALDEDPKKFVFIANEFGYTGTTSPLLAFAKTVEKNELNKGDYVIFWTVGAGTTCHCILYRY